MCGRYASTRSAADLSALFDAIDETDPTAGIATDPAPGTTAGTGTDPAPGTAADPAPGAAGTATGPDGGIGIRPRYNVAPTDPVPFVRVSRQRGSRVIAVGRWGLLPHWARDRRQAAKMINARAETVATAPAFAPAFATRRALVPADGWYEWRRLDGGGKQAYFMTPADGSVLAFAGLWSRWGTDGELTFCVITMPARGRLATVHNRMPLVLESARWQRWLAGQAPPLDPPPDDVLSGLELRPVGPAVGNVRNDGPELLTRVDVSAPPVDSAPTLF